jgi:hypothetical protein
MLRWLQNRELREKSDALRYAEAVIESLERKLAERNGTITVLRQTVRHWHHLHHEATRGAPPERPG